MSISGLIVTLRDDPRLMRQALDAIAARPEFTPGKLSGRWLPLVLEASDDEACRASHDWLNSLPGVDLVEVVHVEFEPGPQPEGCFLRVLNQS
jgi:hypothetical protein